MIFFHFLSFSFIFLHFPSFSFLFFHFPSFSFIFFHFLSFSFIFFHFLSFSFIFFHFLSFSFIFFHFLSFSLIFLHFLSFSRNSQPSPFPQAQRHDDLQNRDINHLSKHCNCGAPQFTALSRPRHQSLHITSMSTTSKNCTVTSGVSAVFCTVCTADTNAARTTGMSIRTPFSVVAWDGRHIVELHRRLHRPTGQLPLLPF